MIIRANSKGEVFVGGVKSSGRSRGLGDTVAKMTKAVGIKPCGGCKKRQEILNRAVPYKAKD